MVQVRRALLCALLLAAPAWADWSTGCGFNFRYSLAGATDDANQTWIGEDSEHEYPTEITACGETINVGWNVNTQAVDWAIGGDPRFDGIVYKTEALTDQATLRIDLPATGEYTIRAAFGSPYWMDTADLAVVFKDNGTAFKILSDSTNRSDGQYWDANGTLRTSEADWISNNTAITHTFTSTTFTIDLGGTSAVENQPLAHLYIELTGEPEPTPTATAEPSASPTAEPTPEPDGDLLLADDFDGGGVSASWSGPYFNSDFYTPTTSAEKFTTSPTPVSGSHVVHYFALDGRSEGTPFQLGLEIDTDELYVSWHEYFESAYCWPTGSQKMLRIGNFNGGTGVRKDFTMVTRESGSNVGYEYQCDSDEGICPTGMGHNSETAHPEDQWVHWVMHLKLNTPDDSDGFIKLYKDGTLFLTNLNMDLRGSDTTGFDTVWLGGNYSMEGGVGTLGCDGNRYLDDIAIYSGEPTLEPIPATPTPTPDPVATPTAEPTATATAVPTATPLPEGELILEDDFDGGAASGDWSDITWEANWYTPDTAIEKFKTSPTPVSGSHVIHYYAREGTNEEGPFYLGLDLDSATVHELYVSWHEYFEGEYCWPTGSQKMLRIGNFSDGTDARKDFTMVTRESGSNVGYEYQCGSDEGICPTGMGHNSETAHPLDSWVHWVMHIKLNTPDDSDGFIKLYKDGNLLITNLNLDLRGSDETGFDRLWLGGNYSMEGGVGTLGCNGSRYLDDIAIYSGEPTLEPIPATPTPTPDPVATPTPTATVAPTPTPAANFKNLKVSIEENN